MGLEPQSINVWVAWELLLLFHGEGDPWNSSADGKLVIFPLIPGSLFLGLISSSYVQTLGQCPFLAIGQRT